MCILDKMNFRLDISQNFFLEKNQKIKSLCDNFEPLYLDKYQI